MTLETLLDLPETETLTFFQDEPICAEALVVETHTYGSLSFYYRLSTPHDRVLISPAGLI